VLFFYRLTGQVAVVGACFQIADAVNAAIQGIFRGTGRQLLGAKLNFVAFYVIGTPLGVTLGMWCGMGLTGLWIGITGGLVTACLSGLYFVAVTDWEHMAQVARSAHSQEGSF